MPRGRFSICLYFTSRSAAALIAGRCARVSCCRHKARQVYPPLPAYHLTPTFIYICIGIHPPDSQAAIKQLLNAGDAGVCSRKARSTRHKKTTGTKRNQRAKTHAAHLSRDERRASKGGMGSCQRVVRLPNT